MIKLSLAVVSKSGEQSVVHVTEQALDCWSVHIEGGLMPNGNELWTADTLAEAEDAALKLARELRDTEV